MKCDSFRVLPRRVHIPVQPDIMRHSAIYCHFEWVQNSDSFVCQLRAAMSIVLTRLISDARDIVFQFCCLRSSRPPRPNRRASDCIIIIFRRLEYQNCLAGLIAQV